MMRIVLLFGFWAWSAGWLWSQTAGEDALILELVKRTDDFRYAEASAKVRAALDRFLEKNRGQKDYFAFVARYRIEAEMPHLLKMVSAEPGKPAAASAAQLVLEMGGKAELERMVAECPGEQLGALAQVLALTQQREAAEILLGVLLAEKTPKEFLPRLIQCLGSSRNGEKVLLEALSAQKIPSESKFQVGQILHASKDETIRTETEKLLPRPKMQGQKPLPPVAELTQRGGDPTNGRALYAKACASCHKLGEEGVEFGPSLAEIGSKLAKEMLYQNIFDPNAGISFGYEGWEVKTQKGDGFVGMIAGETPTELTLKLPGGVLHKIPLTDIATRKALPTSLMPPGLAESMTDQELVDLVEYLTTLKKK
jgi:putative heme-binding domain-containing protein